MEYELKSKQEIGFAIRRARERRGYSQSQLALAIGYTHPGADAYIRKFESGRSYPPYERIRAIHEILGIDYDELIP
ncbi:MAG: helix-turn-helix transcriptional regulator [Clostridia bacterium]|nr:helix-turn-helix transcriptional regulator [Clostridia bacterium]